MYESEQLISAVLRAGARDYLFKSDASGHLLAAVEALASHKPYLTAKVSDVVIHAVTAGSGRR
jgi:DNA-binding NarL/FixJ family response regulator